MSVGTLVVIVAGHTLAENRVLVVDATQGDATNPPIVTPFPTSEYSVATKENPVVGSTGDASNLPVVTPSLTTENTVKTQDDVDPVLAAARIALDVLYARQSSNLKGAIARYSLKTGRRPPRGFDKWFEFARNRSCLIDEYDQIHRDFEPFYQLAQDDPSLFQRRIDVILEMVCPGSKATRNTSAKW
jgi:hypothetical protein